MVFLVEQIIEFISSVMTLEPGDLIMTGTPEGVGEIKKDDVLEANLGNICHLLVKCESEKFLITITELSKKNLALEIGSEVFINFKATDVKLL